MSPTSSEAGGDRSWYFSLDGETHQGPVSETILSRLYEQGEVPLDALIWREGLKKWKPVRDLDRSWVHGRGLPRSTSTEVRARDRSAVDLSVNRGVGPGPVSATSPKPYAPKQVSSATSGETGAQVSESGRDEECRETSRLQSRRMLPSQAAERSESTARPSPETARDTNQHGSTPLGKNVPLPLSRKPVSITRYVMALLTCIGIFLGWAVLSALLGWKHGGGVFPTMIVFGLLGATWRRIAAQGQHSSD